MSASTCILCFELLLKATDRNLVDGKNKVRAELDSLPFVVNRFSPHICKRCLGLLTKRKKLKENLQKADEQLILLYRQKCGEHAISMKRKGPGPILEKLAFPSNLSEVNGQDTMPCGIQEPILEDFEENPYYLSPAERQHQVSTPVKNGLAVNPELTLSPVGANCNVPILKRTPNQCPVTVSIEWADRTRTRVLPLELSALGKMLCRGSKKQIAKAAWKCDAIRKHLYDEIVKQIHRECVAMCVKGSNKANKKRKDSCLRKTDKESIIGFSFDILSEELQERASLFFLVLKTASLNLKDDQEKWKQSVGVAAAVCLRNRSRNMIALQLMIAIINRHSGFMAIMKRMQSLMLMPSHTYFYKKLTQFGQNHDQEILDMVEAEGKRMTAVAGIEEMQNKGVNTEEEEKQLTITENEENEGYEIVEANRQYGSRILESFSCLKTAVDRGSSVDAQAEGISLFWKQRALQEQGIRSEDKPDASSVTSSTDTHFNCMSRDEIFEHAKLTPDGGRKLTLDNIDIHQTTHDMTEDHQNPDAHYCTLMSTENRVSGNHLPSDKQICDINHLENATFCPSKYEHYKQRQNYVDLVSRVMTKSIPCLNSLKDAVVHHIPHQYSKEMAKPTDTTLIGVIYENENNADGMQNILDHLQKYVPSYMREGTTQYSEQGVVGDQLTVERGVNGLFEVANGFTAEERHEGLHFEVADFHGGMKFLEYIFSHFYQPTAANDKCTLYSDRNLINRRNVRTDVSKDVSACKKFFLLELEARVVAATMNELKIEDIDGIPSSDKFQIVSENSSITNKRECLNELASKVVRKYVLRDDRIQAILDRTRAATESSRPVKTVDGERYTCRFPGCTKSFRYDGKRRRNHEKTHNGMVVENNHHTQVSSDNITNDDVFNYQTSFLEVGLLLSNFYDAVSEGDGQRVIRCWKFMLPYLKEDGQSSKKYALEAFCLLCQVHSFLSPRAAHRLIWNRFYKLKSGRGGNIPLDLALEHFNRLIKILIRNLGPNGLNKHAIDRYCKALSVTSQILDNFDNMCMVIRRSGVHTVHSSDGDLKKVVKELVQQKALQPSKGRNYSHFSGMKDSLLADHDVSAFFKWLNMHKKMVLLKKCAR